MSIYKIWNNRLHLPTKHYSALALCVAIFVLPFLLSLDYPDNVRLLGLWDLRLPRTCLFCIFTGVPCPLCGLTRSIISLSHLQYHESFRFHPGAALVYATLIYHIFMRIRCIALGPSFPGEKARMRLVAGSTYFLGLSLVIVWLWRFVIGTLV